MERAAQGEASDHELVRAYVDGIASAFEVILERYETPLLRFVSRYDAPGSQDIVQEVFVRFLAIGDRALEIESLSSWLFRCARNLSIDEARKERRMQRRHELAAAPELQPAATSPVETDEMSDLIATKLLELPTRQRDVLILKIQERKSYREISSITGLTVSNVGYLIHQGLKTLASELRAAGVV